MENSGIQSASIYFSITPLEMAYYSLFLPSNVFWFPFLPENMSVTMCDKQLSVAFIRMLITYFSFSCEVTLLFPIWSWCNRKQCQHFRYSLLVNENKKKRKKERKKEKQADCFRRAAKVELLARSWIENNKKNHLSDGTKICNLNK